MRTTQLITACALLLLTSRAGAQHTGNAVAKQLHGVHEQDDKKIQQQSLSAPFQKLDTAAGAPENKKRTKKSKRVFLRAGHKKERP